MREEISEVVRNPLMWVAASAAFCISAGAIILSPQAKEPVTQVSSSPPTAVPEIRIAERPRPLLPAVEKPRASAEELPAVKIQPVPSKASETESGMPLPSSLKGEDNLEAVAGSRQRTLPGEPNPGGNPPLDAQPFPLPGEPEGQPSQPASPPVVVTPVEPPRPAQPVERAPVVVTPASPARQPERAIQRPRLPTGLLSIYFDADSTTFDQQRRRLPLRVEVWVDGALKARSSDPEKRDLDIGLLSAGWHEVEVVPYVGDLPSQPRRRSVLIEPGTTTEYRAVLRREDGMGTISKFRPRG